jgi:hypothetical protein
LILLDVRAAALSAHAHFETGVSYKQVSGAAPGRFVFQPMSSDYASRMSAQSPRSSSFMLVFARVFASTCFTITAQ